MPLLYYWRPDNYRRDLDMGAGYHLNQANPLFHEIDVGDSVWALTRRSDGTYAFAAQLVVKGKTINPPQFRYGRYRIWGDLALSRYFAVAQQSNAEDVIRSLSIKTNAKILGRAFQGHAAVRSLSSQANQLLTVATRDLATEPRARLLPEDRLEAEMLLGDPATIEKLLREERPGITRKRLEYLYLRSPARNKKLADHLQKVYDGRCQVCQWAPKNRYGDFLCQAHHLQWLSRGGSDSFDNLALLCPNHHIAVHRCDAPFDFGEFAFHFTVHKEPVTLNFHLK